MSPWLIGGAVVGGSAILYLLGRETARPIVAAAVHELLADEAARQGVPLSWALAWVRLESNFDPDAVGDEAISARWQQVAREDPRYTGNPFLDDQRVWVSYGLFQLAAPFWLAHAAEAGYAHFIDSPTVLLDPHVNVVLGIGMLKDLIARTGGNFLQARYIAAGCPQRDCARAERIAMRAARAMDEFEVA